MVEIARDYEAHHKIDTHEKVCAERYGNLNDTVKRIEATLLSHGAAIDMRLTAMSNRMWALVIGGGSSAIIALGAVLFHLITRGKT